MTWKWMVIIVVLFFLIIFTAQNYEPVQIRLLAWSFRSSVAISIFVSLVVGFLIGLLISMRKDY